MWSAPALGSEKEIVRVKLIHALEVGLQNQCGTLLMALIIDQTTNNIGKILSSTKPNYQQHWQDPTTTLARSPHGFYHRPIQTTNNIGKNHLKVLVANTDDDDRHWEARCGDHGTLSVVNHDGADKI